MYYILRYHINRKTRDNLLNLILRINLSTQIRPKYKRSPTISGNLQMITIANSIFVTIILTSLSSSYNGTD